MSLRSGEEIQVALRTFVRSWIEYSGTERSEAQTFLNELFAAYGVDRREHAFFEQPQGTGGIVDCHYPGVAIIEMKRPSEGPRLSDHRPQALEYWRHSDDPASGKPASRYVVLCSFQRFEVWEPGQFPSAPLDTFNLAELPDRYEALYFIANTEPLFLAHRRSLTTEAASVISSLYETRCERAAPDEISEIRLFVLQLVWCLFAESMGLLGADPVERIVQGLISDPSRSSAAELGHLFEVLSRSDQSLRGGLFLGAPYVNGGLFSSPARIHLNSDELAFIVKAANFNWREVDPTIFGSLMEGCLGQQRRFELGAHYTHEIDILRIVRPTIIEPWREKILKADTPQRLAGVIAELCSLQVLDPACGCGNFLFVAYREIRKLEFEAKTAMIELCRATGLVAPTDLASFHIANLHGIEVDEFTAMIARVTLWMGHKLVSDRYGSVEPILPLVDLSGIFVGDALRSTWPRVDVIIGNPPFNGSQNLRRALGDSYVDWLKRTFHCGVKDYCVYWFRRTADHLGANGRAGLVGTNSIAQNRARSASLDYVVAQGGVITSAVSSEQWPGDATVHVAIVNWIMRPTEGPTRFILDDREVAGISTSLRPSDDLPVPEVLRGNDGIAFQGPIPVGSGFILSNEEANSLLEDTTVKYATVVRRYLIGDDIADDPNQEPRRWIIDFASMSLEEASKFPRAIQVVREKVKPERDENNDARFREFWWRFGRPRGEMRTAIRGLDRYLVCMRTGKRLLFVWCSKDWCPSDALNVFALNSDYHFGILSSFVHEVWARLQSSTFETRLRYTPTTAFGTFPWPQVLDSAVVNQIEESARAIVELRLKLCRDGGFGLTHLYNILDEGGYRELADLHLRLDESVAAAYGLSARSARDPEKIIGVLSNWNHSIVRGAAYDPFLLTSRNSATSSESFPELLE